MLRLCFASDSLKPAEQASKHRKYGGRWKNKSPRSFTTSAEALLVEHPVLTNRHLMTPTGRQKLQNITEDPEAAAMGCKDRKEGAGLSDPSLGPASERRAQGSGAKIRAVARETVLGDSGASNVTSRSLRYGVATLSDNRVQACKEL